MDTESLLTNETKTATSPEEEQTQRRSWLAFGALATLLLTVASVAGWVSNYHDAPQKVVERSALKLVPTGVGKKIHPPHPKKLHHGEVLYTTVEDPDVGRYYKREFLVPCGYGLLVFNVGPADTAMPYAFDVFDDGYVYSDNGGLCLFYPSYRAHQNDTQPFWMPSDATSFRVPLGNTMQKISTRINEHQHTKEDERNSKEMKVKGGDYLIMVRVTLLDSTTDP